MDCFITDRVDLVVPHDDTDMSGYVRYFVGTTGTLVVTRMDNTDMTVTMPANSWFLARVKRIKAASSATNVLAYKPDSQIGLCC